MNRSGRFAAYALSMLLVAALSVTTGASPASATITTLCTGYTACAKAGMSDAGYGAVSKTMYWRMYAGHNCTNYAAYRMIRAGLPSTRPWSGAGNATNWGAKMSTITNGTPSVGAVAWWQAGVTPAGSAGHVAYVERVVSPTEIILSQDSWHGDFSWTRVTRTSSGWPSGFVHFRDVRLTNAEAPTISGNAKVGSVLTASPGTWTPAGTVSFAYQWLAGGAVIAGATASTLTPSLAQQGRALSVRVTASRLGYPDTSVVSGTTGAVQPGVLTSTGAPAVLGQAQVSATLSATAGSWNPAPDRVSYQWRSAGTPIPGATAATLPVGPALVDQPVTVDVTATRTGYAAVTATSAPRTVAPGSLRLTSGPTLSGVARPGQVLTVRRPGALPQAVAQIRWLRGGVPVSGATDTIYRVTAADLGRSLSAEVRLTRAGYASLTARSTATAVVRSNPLIRVATVAAGRRRLAVYAAVTASGVRPVAGVVQIRSGKKLLRQVVLVNGVARATLTRLHRGTRTYRFLYVSTTKVSSAQVVRRLRIR